MFLEGEIDMFFQMILVGISKKITIPTGIVFYIH